MRPIPGSPLRDQSARYISSRVIQSRTLYAVLGMLQEGPRSGYDLKREFEGKVRHFWHESVGQIYPALRKAHELGWVRTRAAERGGRRRKEHALTAKGRAALAEWYREPPAPPPVRHELLLKVFFGEHQDPDVLLGHLDRFEQGLREERARFAGYERQIEERARTAEQAELWKLTLASGRHVNRARLAWCKEARAVLEARAERVEETS